MHQVVPPFRILVLTAARYSFCHGVSAIIPTIVSAISASASLSKVLPDTANPELVLFGGAAITRHAGQTWADPGFEAHDARDGNLTAKITVAGTVDTNTAGTYTLTYTVADGAGNTDTTTRTVTVTGSHTVDLNATVAMDMIWCPPGTFTMGSPTTEVDETEHNVSLSFTSANTRLRRLSTRR